MNVHVIAKAAKQEVALIALAKIVLVTIVIVNMNVIARKYDVAILLN